MSRMSRVQIIERFREIAKIPITPDIEIGYIIWDKTTGGLEMAGSHDNPEELIRQLGMWRDSEISAETLQRYETMLKEKGLKDGAGLEEGDPPPRIVMPPGKT